MSLLTTHISDVQITARFNPAMRSIPIAARLGEVELDLTVEHATALRDALTTALADSARPLCPTCDGKTILRIEGSWSDCPTCKHTGMAPLDVIGGAR